jgi:signal transduction histidine kinase
MTLDYPSISFFLALNNLFIITLFAYQYFYHHKKWFLLIFALGIMFQTIVIFIYSIKDSLPLLYVVRFNNFITILSFALTSFALVSFDGKVRKKLIWTFCIIGLLFYCSILFVEENQIALSVIRIISCSVFYGIGSFYLYHNKNKYKFSLLLCGVLFIYSIFQLVRAFRISQIKHSYDFMEGSIINDWFLIITVFVIIASSIGFIMLLNEIDQKTIREKNIKIKKDQLQLEELNLTKNKLFSIISHDLRSPFNSIIGLTDLLKYSTENKDLEESESLATMINTTAKSTLVLLDNLLNWTKSQTGQMSFTPTSLGLQPIVLEVFETLHTNAEAKSISLNYDSSIQTNVYADENMLKTILRNLISNSIKFTYTNGKIDVCAIQKPDLIEINISDNGMGVQEDIRDQLFQNSATTTTLGTANEIGSGLGLLICKEFVDKHNGEIWVESELGKGSVFKFNLPLLKSS